MGSQSLVRRAWARRRVLIGRPPSGAVVARERRSRSILTAHRRPYSPATTPAVVTATATACVRRNRTRATPMSRSRPAPISAHQPTGEVSERDSPGGHVHPGMGNEAAERFPALVDGLPEGHEASQWGLSGLDSEASRRRDLREH
jgi:hypothetical protein